MLTDTRSTTVLYNIDTRRKKHQNLVIGRIPDIRQVGYRISGRPDSIFFYNRPAIGFIDDYPAKITAIWLSGRSDTEFYIRPNTDYKQNKQISGLSLAGMYNKIQGDF